ncbi:hypothetical protein KPH14_003421 [Odynerus spinipes]|uniref:Very-long-chain 3-oxoacyl-CoA synthase n=1 Tax=Odynerus spinipes TaxID=1348599 RepID=A0AAD9RCM1_9HYME|nr:hypothetical protein KPH14_003421 [Odynerus spinipes]
MINPYKSILTSIQIIQLIVISLYITITILPGCNYPKVISFIALPNILLNLYFFQGFYKKSYKRPVKQN